MTSLRVNGFEIFKGRIPPPQQRKIVDDLRGVATAAPFFSPVTPWGKPMRVKMTSAGRYGWFTDRKGYRYIDRHPDGQAWPPIPESILAEWRDLVTPDRLPDCCLVNFYSEGARMGLHRDEDENDFAFPVLSISLGDPATFRIGGNDRSDPTSSIQLESGDVVLMGGAARLAYHGIDRIRFGRSLLLPEGGRLNVTLRVVD
jgi:DNA oxidative demethylase